MTANQNIKIKDKDLKNIYKIVIDEKGEMEKRAKKNKNSNRR